MSRPKTARGMIWTRRARKSASGFHALVFLILMALLWTMINHLSFRHYRREDWSMQQLSVLDAQTFEVLDILDHPVRMISHISRDTMGRDMLEDLLKEYERASSRIRLEMIDPDRDLGMAKDLQARFDLTIGDSLILVSRDRHVILSLEDMLVMESDDTRRMGDRPRLVGFRGESLITAALIRLARNERDVVYFLAGHGEKDIDRFDNDPIAFSDARERLEREGIEVRTLHMDTRADIPADAGALVIAGPSTRIPQPEIDILRRYLQQGGRLYVMLNPLRDGGLEPLLQEWGIQLFPDMVVDPGATLTGAPVHISRFEPHSITRGMEGIRTVFIRPRSILPVPGDTAPAADRPRYVMLARTSPQSWAELDLTEEPIRFNEGVDIPGPIAIAAAVEQTGGAGTRLVVVGDSDFAANWLQSGAGLLFLRNGINWLLERDQSVSLPAAPVDELRILMDKGQLNELLLLVGVAMPGAVALLGFLVAWRRRT